MRGVDIPALVVISIIIYKQRGLCTRTGEAELSEWSLRNQPGQVYAEVFAVGKWALTFNLFSQ